MNLPVLWAQVPAISEQSPIALGLVITLVVAVGGSVVGGIVAWVRGSATQTARLETLRQDLGEESKARQQLETDFKVSKEASQKRHEDVVHRISQVEGHAGRVDERMLNVQTGMTKLEKGQDRIEGKLDDLLSMERRFIGRRKDDKEVA